ncbi:MAG: SBBP repeat-containing protein [Bacteroidales bacterium]
MKKLYIIIMLAIIGLKGNAQTPKWVWAKSAGGADQDFSMSVAVDALGNAYETGYFFSNTITFGSIILTKTNTDIYDGNIFLAKYNSYGNLLWAKNFGGNSDDRAYSVAVDSSGNSYVTGTFMSDTIAFDTITLVRTSSVDIFLAKYDPNGNVLWAKCTNGTDDDFSTGVTVDAIGNPFVTGYFYSPNLIFGSDTLKNADITGESWDIFLAKYNSNGNVLWAKRAGGTDDDVANSVAIDAHGNVYLAGYFESASIAFDTIILINTGCENSFVVKYDSSGYAVWAKTSTEGCSGGNSIAVDILGNSYITGTFGGTIVFGTTTLSKGDIFILKYDSNGNTVWAKSAVGTAQDWSNSIAVDDSGYTYLTGYFEGDSLTFDTTILRNAGAANIFLAKYNATGNLQWAKSIGSTGSDEALSVAVGSLGNIYLTGFFSSPSVDFGSITLTDIRSIDIFIAKLSNDTINGNNDFRSTYNTFIYPNPNNGKFQVSVIQYPASSIEIFNVLGEKVYSSPVTDNYSPFTINIADRPSGVYVVEVKTEKGVVVSRFIKE